MYNIYSSICRKVCGEAHSIGVVVLAADGHQDLADVHTCGGTLGLTEGTTHAGLQPIRSGARQHLVDAQHVEGVDLRTPTGPVSLAPPC